MSDIPDNDFAEVYTDQVDQAGQLTEMLIREQYKRQQEAAKNAVKLTPKGSCHDEDCDLDFDTNEPHAGSKLFCGPECERNWRRKRIARGLPV